MSISGLSSKALYAKAKACYVPHITDEVYEELANLNDLGEFSSYLRGKTPYSKAFEGVGSAGRLTRLHLEAIIQRMTLIRLEKIMRYARLCDNYVNDFFLTKHECECIVRRLRQTGNYAMDSYFLYPPEGVFQNTCFDLAALERAQKPAQIALVLAGTKYEKPFSRMLSAVNDGVQNDRRVPENTVYGYLYESSAAGFRQKLDKKDYAEVEKFLALRGDMMTVNALYRILKYYSSEKEKLQLYVFTSPLSRLSGAQREALMNVGTLSAFAEALEKTCYKGLVPLMAGERAALSTKQYIYNVCRKHFAMSHNAALVALCYGVRVSAEADNLITIAEGISAGVPAQEMLSLLIR